MTIAFIRTIILYLVVIIALRIMGKRQVGELSPSELVVTILISELASIPMQDSGIPLLAGIVPILTLLSLEILISTLTLRSNKFRKILIGKNSLLINNGIINQAEMRRLRLTINELLEELRLKDCMNICEIRYAILETSGKLTVIPYPEFDSPTRADLGVIGDDNPLPMNIILDGGIISDNLNKLKKDESWLYSTLKKRGYSDIRDVFLMQADECGNITLIPKEKK